MKCPFCAEEIQDAAVLCRFCGATRHDGQWHPPGASTRRPPRRKGTFTIKTAAALFVISGMFSLVSLGSEVPLFGAMRGGAVAIAYNLSYAALFLAMGVALWMARPWGYPLVMVATLLYTIDRLAFALDESTRHAYLVASGVTKQVETLIDIRMLDQFVVIVNLTLVACWWGFALYIYLRRDYFSES